MKATLRFNLDDPFDVCAHLRATKSLELALALEDLLEYLRKAEEYYVPPSMADVRLELNHILSRRGLILDELSK